jgi:hypothetical protein
MKAEKTEVVKIRIGVKEKAELDKIAKRECRTFAGQVRLALREWLGVRMLDKTSVM